MPRWNNTIQTTQDIQVLKRAAVLKEAGRAFGKRGYHNTSLDDVAKALHVSKGTLYNYVKDKQEILFECHMMALDLGDKAFTEVNKSGKRGAESLRLILSKYIEMFAQELGACSVLTEVDALRPEDRAMAVKRRDGFERRFIAIIKEGIQDGSIAPVDPKVAVFTFMGAINWIPRWYSPDGRVPSNELAELMTDLFMRGLEPRKVAARKASASTSASSAKPVKPVKPATKQAVKVKPARRQPAVNGSARKSSTTAA